MLSTSSALRFGMSPDPGYSSSQVCTMTGATYRQLDYWVRTGILRPEYAVANGSGTQRRFAPDQVRLVRLILRLRELGVGHDALVDAAARVDDADHADWNSGYLIVTVDGAPTVTLDPIPEVLDLDAAAWVVSLRSCLDDVDREPNLRLVTA